MKTHVLQRGDVLVSKGLIALLGLSNLDKLVDIDG